MKLTKAQSADLRQVLRYLERGEAFLNDPQTHVCRASGMQSNDTFTRSIDSTRLTSINKQVGSDLVAFRSASDLLASFIVYNCK